MRFPKIPSNISFHVTFKVIGEGTHDQEMNHGTQEMSSHLKIKLVFEEPVGIKEDDYNQKEECLEKV